MAKIRQLKQSKIGNVSVSSSGEDIYPKTVTDAVYFPAVGGQVGTPTTYIVATEVLKGILRDHETLANNVGSASDTAGSATVWGKINELNSTVNDVWNAINGDWGIREAIGRDWFDSSKGHTNPKKSITDVIGTTSDVASNNTLWGKINNTITRLNSTDNNVNILQENVSTLQRDISSDVKPRINTLESQIANKANQSDLGTTTKIIFRNKTAWEGIDDNRDKILALDTRVGTAESNIIELQTNKADSSVVAELSSTVETQGRNILDIHNELGSNPSSDPRYPEKVWSNIESLWDEIDQIKQTINT